MPGMMRTRMTEIGLVLKRLRYAFFATLLFSLLINLLLLVPSLYMLQSYDRVLTSRSEVTLFYLTLLAVGLLVIMAYLETVRSRILVRVGLRLDELIGDSVFAASFQRSLMTRDYSPTQGLRDLDRVREFLAGPGLITLFDAPWVPLYLGVVFILHPILGAIAVCGALVIFILAVLNEVSTRKPLGDASQIAVRGESFLTNAQRNTEVISAMHLLPALRARWRAVHNQVLARQAIASDRAGIIQALSKFSRIVVQIAIIGGGAYLAIEQLITPGVMIAASILMGRGLAPVEQSVGQWRGFVLARSAYGRLAGLFRERPPVKAPMALPKPTGHLVMQGVSAAPPGRRVIVLRNISFDLKPGEILAVIGPSAAGKSSFARVVTGVWPPLQGAVRLDGAELQHWDPQQLGPAIGYLPQDVELFEGSVAENIARFDLRGIDAEKVVTAAKKAGAHDMILGFGQAYDTQVGQGGEALSGGQRQRVALARALYDDPALIVLDEPNANLDGEGEAALIQALMTARMDKAAIVVISHRPQILASVDKILVLRNGVMEMCDRREVVLPRLRQRRRDPGTAES